MENLELFFFLAKDNLELLRFHFGNNIIIVGHKCPNGLSPIADIKSWAIVRPISKAPNNPTPML